MEPGAGHAGRVSAFVAYNPKPGESRVFKVSGSAAAPEVSELPARTTVDLTHFKTVLKEELEPALAEIQGLGGSAAITSPQADWVCGAVKRHIESLEDVKVR